MNVIPIDFSFYKYIFFIWIVIKYYY